MLDQQDKELRAFLLETSVLERLSGPLCDAVTGREGSQALLEQAERAGLFLIPLDDVRGWWRYHHLSADLLRARLEGEQPGRVAQLHHNAAVWCEQHGLADEAIRHAAVAGNLTWAARLVEEHFDAAYFLRGEAATIQRWLCALPADLIRTRPRLLLAQALMAALTGRVQAVEPFLDAAESAAGDSAGEPLEPTAGRAASMLVNVPALIAVCRSYLAQLRGDADATATFASRALAQTGQDEWLLRSVARGMAAVADWLRGQLTAAEPSHWPCPPAAYGRSRLPYRNGRRGVAVGLSAAVSSIGTGSVSSSRTPGGVLCVAGQQFPRSRHLPWCFWLFRRGHALPLGRLRPAPSRSRSRSVPGARSPLWTWMPARRASTC